MSAALHILWLILVLGFSAFGLFILASIFLYLPRKPRDRDEHPEGEDEGS
jgi:hypothetical protein